VVYFREWRSSAHRRDFVLRNRPLGNQERPAVASERAARVEQHVVGRAVRERVVAQLRDVRVHANAASFSASTSARRTSKSRPSRSIRRWTMASNMKQSFRTGREPERECHTCSRIVSAVLPSVAMASDIFQAARLRGSMSSRRRALRERNLVHQAGAHERRAFHALDLRIESPRDGGNRSRVAMNGVDGDGGDGGQRPQRVVRRRGGIDETQTGRAASDPRASGMRRHPRRRAPRSDRRPRARLNRAPAPVEAPTDAEVQRKID